MIPAAPLEKAVDFNSNVIPEPMSGCHLWVGPVDWKGYGLYHVQYKRLRAHRVAYEIAYGPIPAGLLVCHRCDNPPCVNPLHLFVGTSRDNVHDCIKKGRSWRAKAKTCVNGHPRDEAHTRPAKGNSCRACTACERDARSVRYHSRWEESKRMKREYWMKYSEQQNARRRAATAAERVTQ